MPQFFPPLIPHAATGALSSILHESRGEFVFVVLVVAVSGSLSLAFPHCSVWLLLRLRPPIPFGVRGSPCFLPIPPKEARMTRKAMFVVVAVVAAGLILASSTSNSQTQMQGYGLCHCYSDACS